MAIGSCRFLSGYDSTSHAPLSWIWIDKVEESRKSMWMDCISILKGEAG